MYCDNITMSLATQSDILCNMPLHTDFFTQHIQTLFH